MKALIALIALFQLTTINAGEYGPCTSWKEARGRTCTFNSKSTQVWIRQCTHAWDLQAICMDDDPNDLEYPCTEWVEQRGTQCSNGYEYAQKWIRSCSVLHYKTLFCSDENPNEL